MTKTFTYGLFEENSHTPFYIGVTKNTKRRYKEHLLTGSNKCSTYTANKIHSILAKNRKFGMRIISEHSSSEEAFKCEILFIRWCRSVNIKLTNILDGGDKGPVLYGESNPSKRLEVRLKISESKKGKKRPDLGLRNENMSSKLVNKCDILGNILETYKSVRQAAKKNNVKYSGIYNCCNGLSKTSHGFKWSYIQ